MGAVAKKNRDIHGCRCIHNSVRVSREGGGELGVGKGVKGGVIWVGRRGE